jgi:diketogulonate reductase-like aldo/keto reductase
MAIATKRLRMELRKFGPIRQQVPVIGQGTWFIDTRNRTPVIAALRHGLDLGMTHIDTAELYGDGAAEKIVGEAIKGRRDEVFLVSKVLPENATRRGTIAACERSLTRLNVERLDCYLLHWRGSHPLDETIDAFEQLIIDGKIDSWGVSNFDMPDLEDLRRITERGPACNQVLYHLEERAIEHRVLPWCEKHDVAVVGYSPFGHGRFPAPRTPQGRVLSEIAAAHGATPRQVALRFLVRRASIFTIPKASSVQHVDENARAGRFHLTLDEVARIEQAFPLGPPPSELPML